MVLLPVFPHLSRLLRGVRRATAGPDQLPSEQCRYGGEAKFGNDFTSGITKTRLKHLVNIPYLSTGCAVG